MSRLTFCSMQDPRFYEPGSVDREKSLEVVTSDGKGGYGCGDGFEPKDSVMVGMWSYGEYNNVWLSRESAVQFAQTILKAVGA